MCIYISTYIYIYIYIPGFKVQGVEFIKRYTQGSVYVQSDSRQADIVASQCLLEKNEFKYHEKNPIYNEKSPTIDLQSPAYE